MTADRSSRHGRQLSLVAKGAQVISVDPDPIARERAIAAGATIALDPRDDVRGHVASLRPDELVGALDSVGFPGTFDLAIDLVRNEGMVAVSGIGTERLRLSAPAHFVRKSIRVGGVYAYTPADIAAVAELLAAGALDFASSVSASFPLEQANEAIAAFASRSGSPVRIVLTND